MPLSFRKITLGFGGPLLLTDISFVLEDGQRACIVGRNGAGKSTLLKIATGITKADSGEVSRPPAGKIAYLQQEIPDVLPGTAHSIVMEAFAGTEMPEWESERRAERILGDLGLPASARFDSMSAGMKRRVFLARALASEPELLLLDEPTNHMDIASISLLESTLRAFRGAVLFVTHDRAFLQNVATRIFDIDRSRLTAWDCDYRRYLELKEAWLEGEARNAAVFDKKLAQEEAWLRQGVKARRTRNEGRVRALARLRDERRQRRAREGSVRLRMESASRSGAKVIEADDISIAWEGVPVISHFSDVVERGDKIGIVGPNGSGKSTLVKLLLKRIKPDSGSVEHGTGLEIAYFDQTREGLIETETVQEAIGQGREYVEIMGQKKHVMSYLQDFLFAPDRARSPVSTLSGGERSRVMLARLFSKPFNVLVMDEPTNDLDLETLEMLEELLVTFNGTLLLVSHDRAFLDNVVTEIYALDGSGEVQCLVGGYSDWLESLKAAKSSPKAAQTQSEDTRGPARPGKQRKFLNREKWELEAIPGEIEAIEKEAAAIAAQLADPATYQSAAASIPELEKRIRELETASERKFARWEELEALRRSIEEGAKD